MADLSRRGLLAGLGFIACAPAIVRVASLMPIKVERPVVYFNRILTLPEIAQEAFRLFKASDVFSREFIVRYEQDRAFFEGSQWPNARISLAS